MLDVILRVEVVPASRLRCEKVTLLSEKEILATDAMILQLRNDILA